MAVKFAPTSHTAPQTAAIDGVTVYGQGPGMVFASMVGGPPVVFLATRKDPDGQPDGMQGFTVASAGTVS